jgi:intracellular septation protein A
MTFDLRLPIGILFTLFGLILTGYGVATRGSEMYQKSLGKNINLEWGIVLLVFGLFMLALTRLGKKPE